METGRFIFVINTEKHYNILVRIITALNRLRIPVHEFSSQIKPGEDTLCIMLTIDQTKDNAMKLSKKLDKEIDVISVYVFEQLPNLSPITQNP